MNRVFALVDCNNFYVSCERVFNRRLDGRAVVVLSNNDGCVIARSNEAKALGIPMGEPFFRCAELLRRNGGCVYSANFTLYGDMSRRVMDTLAQFTSDVEVYSIDEAFLRISASGDPVALARLIRATVRRDTGIPVSIGLAPTRVLAKLANRCAKRNPAAGGVFSLADPAARETVLAATGTDDLWGIGANLARRLRGLGIYTAAALRDLPDELARRHLSVTGLRIVRELRGQPCIEPGDLAAPRLHTIMCSRSFGAVMTDQDALAQAVATFAARGAEKLRAQKSAAGLVMVGIRTALFDPRFPSYANGAAVRLAEPSDYTPDLIAAACRALAAIYKPGYRYRQAEVLLAELAPADAVQRALFSPADPDLVRRRRSLMRAADRINRVYGRETIRPAATGFDRPWRMRQSWRSPRFTTCWNELPVARCG